MLRKLLKEKILILDGAMGTNIQKYKLSEKDYRGDLFKNHDAELKGNNELLSITKPDVIREIHKKFFEAGADIIESNTFGANKISQNEYKLTHYIKELNPTVVGLSNNHTGYYGKDAIFHTLELLNKNNLPYIGAGKNITDAYKPFVFEKDGINFIKICRLFGRFMIYCK